MTISAATTAATTPTDGALIEIHATLDSLNADVHECFAAPGDCDIDRVLNTYFATEHILARQRFVTRWQELEQADEAEVSDDRIQRSLVWITADSEGVLGSSFHCEVDRSFERPKNTPRGAPMSASVGRSAEYLRFYYQWERQPDGSWKIIHSELGAGDSPETIDVNELPSVTPQEVRECA